jgi:heme o synthase
MTATEPVPRATPAAPTAAPAAAPTAASAAAPAAAPLRRRTATTQVGAYVALTKPRIIELLLVTTVPPMFVAAGGWPGLWLVVATLIGGMLTAGSANALNMVHDRDIDAVMARTRDRPLPAGTVTVRGAVVFAVVLGVTGTAWLWATVGWLPAVLSAGALGFYVAVYSWWLKRRTVHNIVIGGAAGAVPALVGWAAVTGSLDWPAWVLFAVVVAWTPPHFWALAVICDRDYAAAAVPMLPSVAGRHEASRRSLRYTVATVGCSLLLPLTTGQVGLAYTAVAVTAGAVFTLRAVRMLREPTPGHARRLFTFSITYLTVLFAAVAIDPLLPF